MFDLEGPLDVALHDFIPQLSDHDELKHFKGVHGVQEQGVNDRVEKEIVHEVDSGHTVLRVRQLARLSQT